MKKYFEFNKQGYYGLITVSVDEQESIHNQVIKAVKIYVDKVGGDSIKEVLEEGFPEYASREYAFWKLANCDGNENITIGELLKQFSETENTCIVVDGALV